MKEYLFITFIVITIILFLICIFSVIIYSHINKKSDRYNKIKKINSETEFDESIKEIYNFTIVVGTKLKYDRFNYFDHLCKIIDETGIDHWRSIQKIAQDNSRKYGAYLRDVNIIQPVQRKGLLKIYTFYESKMCNKIIFKEPITNFEIEICVKYTSPKGRNEYFKGNIFSYKDIEDCYDSMLVRIEKTQSKEYQRGIMSQSLRYDIMKRDGFKCVLCGRTVKDGVKLNVDHIIPISKGGKTIKSNLRTLCFDCNIGKSDKIESTISNEKMIGKVVKVIIDRPLGSYHPKYPDLYYPINYGYIEGILGGDNEAQDAYIMGVDVPLKEFEGKVIAIIKRDNDIEDKWVVGEINKNFTDEEIRSATYFQEQYFKSSIIR